MHPNDTSMGALVSESVLTLGVLSRRKSASFFGMSGGMPGKQVGEKFRCCNVSRFGWGGTGESLQLKQNWFNVADHWPSQH